MQNDTEENGAPRQERTGRLCWHLITSEYPPQRGGVGDYTRLLAAGLADSGDEVHVWCPAFPQPAPVTRGVVVHQQLGTFSPEDLRRVGTELEKFPGPRRLLVQWVPHGYGYRSMNVGFCWWLLQRAKRHGDRVELIVHEPFLRFRLRSLRQNAAALVHRLMTILLLRAANQVWMCIPGWEPQLRPFALGRRVRFEWLPIFSNILVANNPRRTLEIRQQYAANPSQLLVGHFGTFGATITDLLEPILLNLAEEYDRQVFLLMGDQSERYREELIRKHGRLANRVHATGKLPADELSSHLAACDILIQPYPDGVSSRRGSFMAGLSHGKPMITTAGEFTETLWSQVEGVFLAPSGDTRVFVEKVRRLDGSPAERLRAGAAARRLYEERFDSSHLIHTLRQAVTRDAECAY
ncbi:MAG: glycosyltransferase family 4 protein [Bryobacteraceae bacterium]